VPKLSKTSSLPSDASGLKSKTATTRAIGARGKEITKLEAKIKTLEPKPSADPESIKALKVFYKHSTELDAFQLANLMKIEVGKAKHFISSLMVAGYIKSNRVNRDARGPKYIITDAGNEFLGNEDN